MRLERAYASKRGRGQGLRLTHFHNARVCYYQSMARVTPSDRRERILAAARDEFAERGFAAARMADIARRVGVSRSALYQMFDDKEALFRALVADLVGSMLPVLDVPDPVAQPVGPLLQAFIHAALQRMARGDAAFLPRLIVGEGALFPDLVRHYHDHGIALVLAAVERLIAHGVARGEFAPVDPALAARSVAGGILLTALWKIVFEPAGAPLLDINAMASAHADLVLHGLMQRNASDDNPSDNTPSSKVL